MKDGEKQKKRQKRPPRHLVEVPVLQRTVECPSCGGEIEVWADDDKSLCTWCGYQIVTNCRQTH